MKRSSECGPNLGRLLSLGRLVGRAQAEAPGGGFIADAQIRLPLSAVAAGSIPGQFRGRSVMIATTGQMQAALALVALDGIARRLVLCPSELSREQRLAVSRLADTDTVVCEEPGAVSDLAAHCDVVACTPCPEPSPSPAAGGLDTEWVLLTSGTTGPPKLAVHDLASLIAPFGTGYAARPPVWSTFYDIRRYGGLQILLRALVGGGSMVLSEAGEPIRQFLSRAGAEGVTHISGTPSHWRGALMSGASARLSPEAVRLSGEASDQAILDRLQQTYPLARVGHAFASTEAGLGFEVSDGAAGFPASLVGPDNTQVQMRVQDGSLRIRSARTAKRCLGDALPVLRDAAGFVDTGDIVELQGDRYVFIGRRGGIINVGGRKVHPEAVEAVINRHPDVHASRVSARSSPITGAIVVADVVITQGALAAGIDLRARRDEILELCRRHLPAHQVPAMLRQQAALEIDASGKLARRYA